MSKGSLDIFNDVSEYVFFMVDFRIHLSLRLFPAFYIFSLYKVQKLNFKLNKIIKCNA